ncbi:MAG: hypothetical protein ACK5PB_23430 [Pirellula sp.]|jgi:hypothetical protein
MDRVTFETIVRSRTALKGSVTILASELRPAYSHHGPVYIAMSGYQSRAGRHAIQLVDHDIEHDDPLNTVRSVVGSIKNAAVRGAELVGVIAFASDDESQQVKSEFDSGIRRTVQPFVHVVCGCQLRNGERWSDTITGPALIAVDWRLAYALTSKEW